MRMHAGDGKDEFSVRGNFPDLFEIGEEDFTPAVFHNAHARVCLGDEVKDRYQRETMQEPIHFFVG